MNKKISMLLIFTTFILLIAFQGYAHKKKIILPSVEYPPYYGKNLEDQGFLTEVIREAFKRADYELEVKIFPWARCMMMAKKGYSDGMFSIWYTVEREKWFVFSNPIPPPNTIGFYKQKDKNIVFKTYQDLKPYRIGSILGYAYPLDITKIGLRNNKSYTDEMLITKLVQGKIDLALIDKLQAEYLIKTKFPEQIHKFEFMKPPLEIKQQHLVISKKTKNANNIVSDFNRGLKAIMDDGTFKDILEKHGF